jgi:LysM repeat protein
LTVFFQSAEVGDFISRRETMNTNRFLSIVVIVILAASMLAACSRSASKAPALTPTTKGSFPSLGKTPQVNQQDAIKTQTAIAKQNLNPILDQPTSTATPKPVVAQATNTKAPAVVEATTAPVAGVNVPTVTPGRPATYTLQEGEFVYCVARRFNVDPATLQSLNGLTGNLVYKGMTLKIPQSGKFPDTRALIKHPSTYTVKSGDTIYTVACKFGDVEPWAIAMANGLQSPYTLTAGAVINIP